MTTFNQLDDKKFSHMNGHQPNLIEDDDPAMLPMPGSSTSLRHQEARSNGEVPRFTDVWLSEGDHQGNDNT